MIIVQYLLELTTVENVDYCFLLGDIITYLVERYSPRFPLLLASAEEPRGLLLPFLALTVV